MTFNFLMCTQARRVFCSRCRSRQWDIIKYKIIYILNYYVIVVFYKTATYILYHTISSYWWWRRLKSDFSGGPKHSIYTSKHDTVGKHAKYIHRYNGT